jgi:hypothetical protein
VFLHESDITITLSHCTYTVNFLEVFFSEECFATVRTKFCTEYINHPPQLSLPKYGGFIKGILRGVRCTKSLRVLFLHRRPPSWTTLTVLKSSIHLYWTRLYSKARCIDCSVHCVGMLLDTINKKHWGQWANVVIKNFATFPYVFQAKFLPVSSLFCCFF